jgi:hypothetical protein
MVGFRSLGAGKEKSLLISRKKGLMEIQIGFCAATECDQAVSLLPMGALQTGKLR